LAPSPHGGPNGQQRSAPAAETEEPLVQHPKTQSPAQHAPEQQVWLPMQQAPLQQLPLTPTQLELSALLTQVPSLQTWQEGAMPHGWSFLAVRSQRKFSHVPHSPQASSVQQAALARQTPPQHLPPGQSAFSALATHWPLAQTLQADPPHSCPSPAGWHVPFSHFSHSPHSASVQQPPVATQALVDGQHLLPLPHRLSRHRPSWQVLQAAHGVSAGNAVQRKEVGWQTLQSPQVAELATQAPLPSHAPQVPHRVPAGVLVQRPLRHLRQDDAASAVSVLLVAKPATIAPAKPLMMVRRDDAAARERVHRSNRCPSMCCSPFRSAPPGRRGAYVVGRTGQ
jgi:hypothetical protein